MGADDGLPPDAVIEELKREVDRPLLRENLKLTPEQRLMKLQDFVKFTYEFGEAGRAARSRPKT